MTDFATVAMWTAKAAARHTPSTSSPRHTGRATAPDAAARWRRSSGPQAALTRPHPRRPRRPYVAPLRAHIGASRHPVLTPLPQATLSHQTLLHPSTPAFAYPDPRGAPCTGRLDGSPRARNHPRRRRKYPKYRPCRIDAHDSALRARHAPRAQRTPQHRRFDYNILWPGRFHNRGIRLSDCNGKHLEFTRMGLMRIRSTSTLRATHGTSTGAEPASQAHGGGSTVSLDGLAPAHHLDRARLARNPRATVRLLTLALAPPARAAAPPPAQPHGQPARGGGTSRRPPSALCRVPTHPSATIAH